MITLRKSDERGHADHGWLDARHSFSFGDYRDPARMSFRSLRVINEDRVAPGRGFEMHPHADMEIITYVIEGQLQHRDSMGHSALMGAGDVQRISAGTGIRHSEFNASPDKTLHLLQIWITPDRQNAEPAYAEKTFTQAERGRLHLIASQSGRDGSIAINQDADLYLGRLGVDDLIKQPLRPGRHAWLQVISGELDLNGRLLGAGDAAQVSEESSLLISALQPSDFLLFDLN